MGPNNEDTPFKLPTELFEPKTFGSLAGCVSATWIVTNVFCGYFHTSQQTTGLIVALLVAYINVYFTQKYKEVKYCITAFFNAFLIYTCVVGITSFSSEINPNTPTTSNENKSFNSYFSQPWHQDNNLIKANEDLRKIFNDFKAYISEQKEEIKKGGEGVLDSIALLNEYNADSGLNKDQVEKALIKKYEGLENQKERISDLKTRVNPRIQELSDIGVLSAFDVSDIAILEAHSSLGVPLYPEFGSRAVSSRLPSGTVVTVDKIGTDVNWLEITGEGKTGWIIKKYIKKTLPPYYMEDVKRSAGYDDKLYNVIATWDLEHFHKGTKRGFPENTLGGPTYPPRTPHDYKTIASIIKKHKIRILVLQEIHAQDRNGKSTSEELDILINNLGSHSYKYIIGQSGGSQRIAILFDERYVRLNSSYECNFPEIKINHKSLFDRQPLLAHFTFIDDGNSMNDLLVVGIHLASGQHNFQNHSMAMELLVNQLNENDLNDCRPFDENDIVIMGNFNENLVDNNNDNFWKDLEQEGWDILADDRFYPETRLGGRPLTPKSTIDYIVVTKGDNGLSGEEIKTDIATVHTKLVGDDPDLFRRSASDHIPVSVKVLVMKDTD